MATTADRNEVMATLQAHPRSADELTHALAELPRPALRALCKTHGVAAVLKRDTMVAKLQTVLAEVLFPGGDAKVNKADDTRSCSGSDVHDKEKEPQQEQQEQSDLQKDSVEEAKAKTVAVAVVTTPTKATRRAQVTSQAMQAAHTKQMARQPTLQEHERAKRQRAADLLACSKFSAVKKTRSKTRALAGATGSAAVSECTVTKTLSFASAVPSEAKASAMSKKNSMNGTGSKKRTAEAISTMEDDAQTKKKQKQKKEEAPKKPRKMSYTPYVGPLPSFSGDSLFSPRKAVARPAPMSVAVMKAARVLTPQKKTASQPRQRPRQRQHQELRATTNKENAKPTDANQLNSTGSKPPQEQPHAKTQSDEKQGKQRDEDQSSKSDPAQPSVRPPHASKKVPTITQVKARRGANTATAPSVIKKQPRPRAAEKQTENPKASRQRRHLSVATETDTTTAPSSVTVSPSK